MPKVISIICLAPRNVESCFNRNSVRFWIVDFNFVTLNNSSHMMWLTKVINSLYWRATIEIRIEWNVFRRYLNTRTDQSKAESPIETVKGDNNFNLWSRILITILQLEHHFWSKSQSPITARKTLPRIRDKKALQMKKTKCIHGYQKINFLKKSRHTNSK